MPRGAASHGAPYRASCAGFLLCTFSACGLRQKYRPFLLQAPKAALARLRSAHRCCAMLAWPRRRWRQLRPRRRGARDVGAAARGLATLAGRAHYYWRNRSSGLPTLQFLNGHEWFTNLKWVSFDGARVIILLLVRTHTMHARAALTHDRHDDTGKYAAIIGHTIDTLIEDRHAITRDDDAAALKTARSELFIDRRLQLYFRLARHIYNLDIFRERFA